MKIPQPRRVIFAMRSTPPERLPMLRVEGRIANHDREFIGAIEINTETGLIEWVGPATGESDLDLRGQIIFPGFGDLHIHAREDASQLQIQQ
jgi:dihydroorotase